MWKTFIRVATTAYNLAVGFGVVLLAMLIFEADWILALPVASTVAVVWAWFRAKYPNALNDNVSVPPAQLIRVEEAKARAHATVHGGSQS